MFLTIPLGIAIDVLQSEVSGQATPVSALQDAVFVGHMRSAKKRTDTQYDVMLYGAGLDWRSTVRNGITWRGKA